MKRTNIMLTDEQHGRLKSYSKNEKRTLGELVRDALDVAYKTKDIVDGFYSPVTKITERL